MTSHELFNKHIGIAERAALATRMNGKPMRHEALVVLWKAIKQYGDDEKMLVWWTRKKIKHHRLMQMYDLTEHQAVVLSCIFAYTNGLDRPSTIEDFEYVCEKRNTKSTAKFYWELFQEQVISDFTEIDLNDYSQSQVDSNDAVYEIRKLIDTDRAKAVFDLLMDGLNSNDIADKLKCKRQSINQLVKRSIRENPLTRSIYEEVSN